MDLQNMDLKGGSLQISTEVIGKIARCAALEIEGVAEVSCGKQNRKVKDLLERANVQSPVTVEMRDGTAEITLEIVAAFGARIPAVAEKVQENVKSRSAALILSLPVWPRRLSRRPEPRNKT